MSCVDLLCNPQGHFPHFLCFSHAFSVSSFQIWFMLSVLWAKPYFSPSEKASNLFLSQPEFLFPLVSSTICMFHTNRHFPSTYIDPCNSPSWAMYGFLFPTLSVSSSSLSADFLMHSVFINNGNILNMILCSSTIKKNPQKSTELVWNQWFSIC